VRLAVLGDDGVVVEEDRRSLDMFGGVLPSVGDHIATLWPVKDPDPNEHYRVIARYYVGEFAGDTCRWLLLAPELSTDRDEGVFEVARKASADTRRLNRERSKRQTEAIEALLVSGNKTLSSKEASRRPKATAPVAG
jgi:hypothetical protein